MQKRGCIKKSPAPNPVGVEKLHKTVRAPATPAIPASAGLHVSSCKAHRESKRRTSRRWERDHIGRSRAGRSRGESHPHANRPGSEAYKSPPFPRASPPGGSRLDPAGPNSAQKLQWLFRLRTSCDTPLSDNLREQEKRLTAS